MEHSAVPDSERHRRVLKDDVEVSHEVVAAEILSDELRPQGPGSRAAVNQVQAFEVEAPALLEVVTDSILVIAQQSREVGLSAAVPDNGVEEREGLPDILGRAERLSGLDSEHAPCARRQITNRGV